MKVLNKVKALLGIGPMGIGVGYRMRQGISWVETRNCMTAGPLARWFFCWVLTLDQEMTGPSSTCYFSCKTFNSIDGPTFILFL